MYPAKFPGLGEALIFFCFFSCIKTRKEDYEGKKKTPFFDVDHSSPTENAQEAYAIRPYSLIPDRFRIRFATSLSKTRRVLDFATRHDVKPGGFWTLPHDIERNPAGFGLCHTT